MLANILADKSAKAESKQKKKFSSTKNSNCGWCKLSCNSDKMIHDRNSSARHKRIFVDLQIERKCSIGDREFWCTTNPGNQNLCVKYIKVARAIQVKKK